MSLCQLSRNFSTQAAHLLEVSGHLSRRFREETFTDLLMGALLGASCSNILVEYPNEPKTGADMVWDFPDIKRNQFFRLLIQAKRIGGKGRYPSRYHYPEIYHRVRGTGRYQARTLCRSAGRMGSSYPIYMFYTNKRVCDWASLQGYPGLTGASMACGYQVKALVNDAVRNRNKKRINKNVKTIAPIAEPLETLFCITAQSRSALKQINGNAISPEDWLPPTPADVRAWISGRIVDANRLCDKQERIVPPVANKVPDKVRRRIHYAQKFGMPSSDERLKYHRITFISGDQIIQ